MPNAHKQVLRYYLVRRYVNKYIRPKKMWVEDVGS